MNRNIRRTAAVLSLTALLSFTPLEARTSREERGDRERTPVVRTIKRLIQKFFGVTPTQDVVGPIPAPPGNNP